ncbi:hypothetical protein [Bacillus thuringiensis]|uniref:hypothetical protein n=1 Tax=Bacillus thuringiensis TaxID=1428 RepID=UPI00345AEDD2
MTTKKYIVDPQSRLYEYWEVFKYAAEGDVFQLTQSTVPLYEDTKVYMHKTSKNSMVMHNLQHEGYNYEGNGSNIITPYGAFTGGKYRRMKKLKERVKITFDEAVQLINKYEIVIAVNSNGKEYEINSPYFDFKDMGVEDFDDMAEITFHKEIN